MGQYHIPRNDEKRNKTQDILPEKAIGNNLFTCPIIPNNLFACVYTIIFVRD